jgi:single-strand DNA-binding protein
MSKAVNKVFLMGRLVSDIEMKTTAGGKNIAEFRLAVDNGTKDDGAYFFDVTAWEKLADLVNQYTKKGSKVLVEGRLQQDTWDDKETGKKRSKVVITATDVTFLDAKPSGDQTKDVAPTDIDDKPIDLSQIPF